MDKTELETLASLQAEVAALRAEKAASDLEARLNEREREYRQRIQAIEHAASGDDSDRQSQRLRTSEFRELMRQMDVDRLKGIVEQVHTTGYAIVPDLLDEAQLERVREGMAPLFAGSARLFADAGDRYDHQTLHVQNVFAKTEVADEVATIPLLRAIVAGVLGHDYVFNAGAVAMAPDPGCRPQNLHQDDGFFTMFPRPHIPLVVTAAIALDDFTAANGGTQVVPGSCLWPTDRKPEENEVVRSEARAGSLLLWDGALLHGGGGNTTTGQSRRTLTFNYARGWLRTQFNHYLSIPHERVLAMRPELQSDLGYHHSVSGLGGCDTQDPLRYLERLRDAGGDGEQHSLGRESGRDRAGS